MNNKLELIKKIKTVDNRNIILFLTGKFVSLFGTNIYAFSIGLYLLKITGSGMSFSLNFALNTIPRILLGPIAGVISDRLDKKKLVVITDMLSGLLLIILFFIIITNELNIIYIYITTILLTSLNTIFGVSFTSSLPNLVNDENLVKITSYNTSINSLTNILGPVVGGLVYGFFDIKYIILINGISFVLSSISEYMIDFEAYKSNSVQTSSKEKSSILNDIKEGLNYIKQKKVLFTLFMIFPIINFLFTAINICFPYITVQDLLLPSKYVGIIEGSFACGMLLMSLIFSYIPEIKRVGLSIGLCTASLGLLTSLIGIPVSGLVETKSLMFYVIYYCTIGLIIGCFIVLINLPLNLTLQRKTPENFRGRLFGILDTISSIITPIACILFGFLIDIVPSHLIVFISGGLLVIVGIMISFNKTLHKI
ncbi:MFS transporter [Abyssisolibacter fermentans]|uniref:MFS transporter n=1 Tax=Abyssisolibacter fermentans TaxID=1766203 RepID=UPI00082B738F|nr:MFS transporter [Abyssisolibacter fermentans]